MSAPHMFFFSVKILCLCLDRRPDRSPGLKSWKPLLKWLNLMIHLDLLRAYYDVIRFSFCHMTCCNQLEISEIYNHIVTYSTNWRPQLRRSGALKNNALQQILDESVLWLMSHDLSQAIRSEQISEINSHKHSPPTTMNWRPPLIRSGALKKWYSNYCVFYYIKHVLRWRNFCI